MNKTKFAIAHASSMKLIWWIFYIFIKIQKLIFRQKFFRSSKLSLFTVSETKKSKVEENGANTEKRFQSFLFFVTKIHQRLISSFFKVWKKNEIFSFSHMNCTIFKVFLLLLTIEICKKIYFIFFSIANDREITSTNKTNPKWH